MPVRLLASPNGHGPAGRLWSLPSPHTPQPLPSALYCLPVAASCHAGFPLLLIAVPCGKGRAGPAAGPSLPAPASHCRDSMGDNPSPRPATTCLPPASCAAFHPARQRKRAMARRRSPRRRRGSSDAVRTLVPRAGQRKGDAGGRATEKTKKKAGARQARRAPCCMSLAGFLYSLAYQMDDEGGNAAVLQFGVFFKNLVAVKTGMRLQP